MTPKQPSNTIDWVNKLVRTSRQIARDRQREPTPEELAHRLAIPVDKVRRLWEIARTPMRLRN